MPRTTESIASAATAHEENKNILSKNGTWLKSAEQEKSGKPAGGKIRGKISFKKFIKELLHEAT